MIHLTFSNFSCVPLQAYLNDLSLVCDTMSQVFFCLDTVTLNCSWLIFFSFTCWTSLCIYFFNCSLRATCRFMEELAEELLPDISAICLVPVEFSNQSKTSFSSICLTLSTQAETLAPTHFCLIVLVQTFVKNIE